MPENKKTLIEIMYYVVACLVGLITAVGAIYIWTEENWKTTCYIGVGVVAIVVIISLIFLKPSGFYEFCTKKILPISVKSFWVLVVVIIVLFLRPINISAKQGLVAVVNCTHWDAPAKVADTAKMAKMKIHKWRTMYTINLQTNNPEGVEKPTLRIPNAHYIEVEKDGSVISYVNEEKIDLPFSLCNGERIDIRAWTTCKANKRNAEQVRVTYLGGRQAYIDAKKPTWVK